VVAEKPAQGIVFGGNQTISKERFRWSQWAKVFSGENLVRFIRGEGFPFFIEVADRSAINFMDGARLGIDEPTVLTQYINKIDELRLDAADADTKGDLFEHVLRQIKQAGELGQFRTPCHIIRAIVKMLDPRIGETIHLQSSPGTVGFLVVTYDHLRLAHSSEHAIETAEVDACPELGRRGKPLLRGHGDRLNLAQWQALQERTLFGNDVDPKMVRLATMNLTLRGLPDVRIQKRNVLTTTHDHEQKRERGLPVEGYHFCSG